MPDSKRPTTPAPLQHADYRPDIDGLRAISIIAVVWYHAVPAFGGGGFVGVDIFFVISGFLISRIILGQLEAGRFSIAEFYRRRVRRIFPALVLVLLATFIAGWLVLLPNDFARLGANMLGGAGFFSNIVLLRSQDYFAPDAATNPLLHLWSLGIEEQFYIVWPLLLFWLHGRGARVWLIALVALASFAANVALVSDHPALAFYSPMTRAWQLMMGAMLAAANKDDSRVWQRHADLKAVAGLLLIAAAILLLGHASRYPGWNALLPSVGAALLLSAPGSLINRRVLAHPLMVFVGLISYPLYLWHWPLLSYLGIVRNGNANPVEVAVAVALAVLLAWLTYRWIERPLRQWHLAVIGLAGAMTVVAALALITVSADGFDFRFPPDIRAIAAMPAKENSGFKTDCFLEDRAVSITERGRCVEGGEGRLVAIWGDSTAAALMPGFRHAQDTAKFRLGQLTAAGCTPILKSRDVFIPKICEAQNDQAFDLIKASRPDVVVLHAMWNPQSNDLARLRDTLAALKQAGIAHVILLGPVPVWKRGLPFLLVNHFRLTHQLPERLAIARSRPESDLVFEQIAQQSGVGYISAWSTLCNEQGCVVRTGPAATDIMASDNVHLTDSGARYLVERIAPQLSAN
jgi:peptidoglycan/LPS O-acetylase OafA/YrhL